MTSQRCIQLFLIVLLVTLMSAPHAPTLAAVTISSFEALGQVGQIVVMWTTANESDNVGFNLWRDTSENFVRPTLLNDQQLIPSQCLGCLVGTDYVYTDTAVTPGQLYFYKLESEDINSQLETYAHVTFARASAPSVAPTYPPTHTPVPSPTPTPTATGTGGPSPTATATLSISTPTPTSTPQTETPAAPGSTATATPPLQVVAPNASATPAPPLPASPTPTRAVEPGRTATAFSTVVIRTVAPGPTATRSTAAQAAPSVAAPTATLKTPASSGGPSIPAPTRPAQLLSPAGETSIVELGRVLIGTGLIGMGAALGLSVLAVIGYFLWRRSSRS